MVILRLFDNISLLSELLEAKTLRHDILLNNIANADTPNFKRSDVSFEEKLRKALEDKSMPLDATHEKHFTNKKNLHDIKPNIYMQKDRSLRNDNNNVDIDKEMVELSKNMISYNIVSDQIQKNFKILQSAISEGRK